MKGEDRTQAVGHDVQKRVESAAVCESCEYALRGLPATVSVCPECGAAVDPSTYEPPAWYGNAVETPGLTAMEIPGYLLGVGVAVWLADRVVGIVSLDARVFLGGWAVVATFLLVLALKRADTDGAGIVLRACAGAFLVALGGVVFLLGVVSVYFLAILVGAVVGFLGHVVQVRTGHAMRKRLADAAGIRRP